MSQLSLTVSLNGPVSSVFEAFVLPEKLIQWFAPGEVFVAQVMSDFQEGGRYTLTMQEPSGQQYQLVGEYLAIEQNAHIRYSWAWMDNEEETVMSIVDIVFVSVNDTTTEVTLTHSGFANDDERDQHQYAWIACLEKLSRLTLSD